MGKKVEEREENFSRVGPFPVVEFKRMAPVMERRGIRFRLEFDDAELRRLVPKPDLNAASTSGLGVKVVVSVHDDDVRRFQKLVREVLGE